MMDAYEMRDYEGQFKKESSSSVHMKKESRDNTTEAYLKELKRRADEATRKNFTDKLSDRIKELNEVLNTKALEEMIQFIENRPIKLKGTNFANMKKISETMNASLANDIGTNEQAFDVQSVNPYGLKSNVSDAFASYGSQDSSIGEVSSFAESKTLPAVIPDDMSKGSSHLNPAVDLSTNNEVASCTESEPISAVNPDDMSKGSSYFNSAVDLSTNNEVASGTEPEPISAVNPDGMSKGSSYFNSAVDLSANAEAVSSTEAGTLPAVNPDDMSKGSSYLNPAVDLSVNGEAGSSTESEPLPVNDEVVSAIDDYVVSHIGSREDTSSSDMSSDFDSTQTETTEFKSSDIDDNNGKVYLSDGQLKEEIADYIGAQRTEDGNYTFPVATTSGETPKVVIRGDDVQVVPERKDTSVSAEIGYADNNEDSQVNEGLAEEGSDDVTQSEEPFGFDSPDMSSSVEGENESEKIDSSPVINPFLGDLVGYNNSDGGLNFSSLVPDLIRQHDETARIGLELDDRIGEQVRKKSELEKQEAMQAQTTRELAGKLYNLTALEASKNAEKQETIEGNNKELELMMKTIRDNASTIATLRQMLGESTDVNEDSDVKGRSK